ncbi:TPR repeat protein [Phyllobacterium myrsinacearum]|uniref:TPR repeat protein n=1 Tax=Phyllobacterium myrsinacearum TaxID=28101 RepID=A0A839ENG0_9HYPH|nr:TPR repeat protein [Phyllobacterium myrsinacearum]
MNTQFGGSNEIQVATFCTYPHASLVGVTMRQILIMLGSFAMVSLSVNAWADPGYDAYMNEDYATALKHWRPQAERGDAYSQFSIGVMYSNGEGVTQDDAKAIYWYRKAAENGEMEAQLVLGDIYRDGSGVKQDKKEAAKWYREAAKLGHAGAKYQLNQLSSDPCIQLSPNDNYVKGFKSTIFANIVTGKDVKKAKAMLACGASLNAVDGEGYYPIHLAATRSTRDMIELLLVSGAKVNERSTITGESPLHLAVIYNKDPAVIRTLLEHGADRNQINNAGKTPIQSTENPATIELLK